jgi:uncharacterized protein
LIVRRYGTVRDGVTNLRRELGLIRKELAYMDFDRYTITLLLKAHAVPEHDEQAAVGLQDAHMSHLSDLHEAGVLLAAGPLFDERFQGLSIMNVEPERALELDEQDPAVRAGLYSTKAISWMVPGGVMSFKPGHLPRSVAEAGGG